ncbi:MAG: segregation/condensation protein A [Planctomycetota bacterium]
MDDETRQPEPGPDADGAAEPPERRPEMAGARYRVALDTYSGPLDLLLYLIRKNEVDIGDIPVAVIAEQYQQYLGLMAQINVNVAGEFLVMASTLMEIKSRMLLPREEELEEEEEDPRSELVRQLLEYRKYKDAARELGARARQASLKYPRPGPEALPDEFLGDEEGDEAALALEGVGLWELIDAFARVLSETSLGPEPRMLERERPIHEFRRELLDTVSSERTVRFSELFQRCRTREDMIGTFIALLELVRLQRLRLQQAARFGEIYVCLAEDTASAQAHAQLAGRQAAAAAGGQAEPERRGPVTVNEADVLKEIEEEDEALGGARKRIDAALRRVETFLKEHHRAVQEQAGEDEEGEDDPAAAPSDDGGREDGGSDEESDDA